MTTICLRNEWLLPAKRRFILGIKGDWIDGKGVSGHELERGIMKHDRRLGKGPQI
jgi:hypothetical protein